MNAISRSIDFMSKYYISHRGNVNRCNPDKENHPDYVQRALDMGFDVEVDLWFICGEWYLGHDDPKWCIDEKFLQEKGLWLHCKNASTMSVLASRPESGLKFFWHQEDDIALTSNRLLWTHPKFDVLFTNSVAVMPENSRWIIPEIRDCIGVCSDYIERYAELC